MNKYAENHKRALDCLYDKCESTSILVRRAFGPQFARLIESLSGKEGEDFSTLVFVDDLDNLIERIDAIQEALHFNRDLIEHENRAVKKAYLEMDEARYFNRK